MNPEINTRDYSVDDKLLAGKYVVDKSNARKGIACYASTLLLSVVVGFGVNRLIQEVPKELSDLRVAQEELDSLAAGRKLENFVSLTNTPEVAEYVAKFGEGFNSEYEFLRGAHYSLQRKMDDCGLASLEKSYNFLDKTRFYAGLFAGFSSLLLIKNSRRFKKAKKGLEDLNKKYPWPLPPAEDKSGPEFRNGK